MDQPELPLVSVIVPTYRRPTRLAGAIESIDRQSYSYVEIVVVDDNPPESSDRTQTARAVEEMRVSRPLRLVQHPTNRGGSAARNSGVAASRGALVAFLDDDDRWEPTKLERQVARFDEYPATGLVYTGLRIVDEDGRTVRLRSARRTGLLAAELAVTNVVGTTSSVMMRRTVFDSVGGFDESLPARQDMDLWFRVAQRYPIVAVDEPLTIFVHHRDGRVTARIDGKRLAREAMLRKYAEYYRAHRGEHAAALRMHARFLAHNGEHSRARSTLLKAMVRRPSLRTVYRLAVLWRGRGNGDE